ncbi:gamma-glutamylcyclotransferase family protein [Acidihalobacter ferrooxydans]|uniref:Gamma-glutamylcyclotransferase n=1 Tax=Acidihalobacter ferrooxydans TaxID=1765967 RepID=A0A1P8UJ50_9GAMM|nr:gamma-glutamylcyclotransferase family protein [Acidihalobacter ferrooxydans]APZ43834.1 hypothetical protein BW247_12650 [Acidihalobacter ferrooxydans]
MTHATDELMLYFAYGSNMSSARLRARVAGAYPVGIGLLVGYRLAFHVLSRKDGSAKCDAYYTGREADAVYGVLFSLPASELAVLDRYEGHPHLYERGVVEVLRPDGAQWEAQTYIGRQAVAGLRPLDWYREHVLRGAREHELPEAYVAQLAAVAADRDTDAERRARELAIYAPA